MPLFGGPMAKKSGIYLFTRDERSAVGFMSPNEAATDAAGVVLNWEAASSDRSCQPMLDQHEFYIARLTYDDAREQEAADDLDDRLTKKGLKREGITEMQVDKLRSE